MTFPFETGFAQNWFEYFKGFKPEYLQSESGLKEIHHAKNEIAKESRKDAHTFGNMIMSLMYAENEPLPR